MKNPQDRLLSSPQCLMVSRILYVNRRGGAWGLGEIVGEFDVEPNHWVFKSHFCNDPVMPGTMLSEGCNQVAVFYMYYLGLHEKFDKFYVTWLDDRHLKTKGKFRGEIKAGYHQVQYRITVREINIDADPYIIAAGEIIFNDKVIGTFDKIGLQIRQK